MDPSDTTSFQSPLVHSVSVGNCVLREKTAGPLGPKLPCLTTTLSRMDHHYRAFSMSNGELGGCQHYITEFPEDAHDDASQNKKKENKEVDHTIDWA